MRNFLPLLYLNDLECIDFYFNLPTLRFEQPNVCNQTVQCYDFLKNLSPPTNYVFKKLQKALAYLKECISEMEDFVSISRI